MDATTKANLLAQVGKKTAESCEVCGAVLVVRMNRQNESFFLGCNRYPDCRFTKEISETMRLTMMGVKPMF